jgi:hypothetical protein
VDGWLQANVPGEVQHKVEKQSVGYSLTIQLGKELTVSCEVLRGSRDHAALLAETAEISFGELRKTNGEIEARAVQSTEAGAVGALGALVVALVRRRLDGRTLWQTLIETGHVSVSVLFLIIAASLYSRMLALTGIPGAIGESITGAGLGPLAFVIAYIGVVLLLGCIIDSISIMLIVLPVVLPGLIQPRCSSFLLPSKPCTTLL